MKRYQEIDPGDDVYCEHCKTVRVAKVIDVGVGPTEAWGVWGNDVDLRTVCGYCESEDIVHPHEVEEEEGA